MMEEKKDHGALAKQYFLEGYNCAQSVVLAFHEELGLEKEAAARMISSFGGGMGRLREVCGTVSGMLFAAGILYGYSDPKDMKAKKEQYERVQKLAGEFRQQHGSIVCRELLGLDHKKDDPVPSERTKEYYAKRPCAELAASAARILEGMMEEMEQKQRMGKSKYRCCIFDLDGTLINTLSALTKVINLTLGHFGLEPVDQEHTKVFVGDGYQKFVKRAFVWRGWKETDDFSEAFSVYNEFFKEHCLDGIEAYEGIRELLSYLKKKQMKIAVLSNKSQSGTVACIETVFGKGYFDLVTGERQGVPRKPDPAGVFYTMESLEVRPEECLYFGDTNTDMETGKAAGLDTVGVTWGFRDRAELEGFSPRYLVDDPREMIKLLEMQEA